MNSRKPTGKDLYLRLARIQGHLNGIIQMLDAERPYSEVVHQIAAVRASFDSLVLVMVGNVLSDCAQGAGRKDAVSNLEEIGRLVAEIRSSRAYRFSRRASDS